MLPDACAEMERPKRFFPTVPFKLFRAAKRRIDRENLGGVMWYKLSIIAFFVLAVGVGGCTSERYSQNYRGHQMKVDSLRVMKMQDVIDLSNAGVSDSLIIATMDATNSYFQLKAKDVLHLRKSGVSEAVISAMMQPPPESSNKSSASNNTVNRYYAYPYPYYWYDDFYPYWYYPSFSVRLGGFYHRPAFIHGGGRFHR
jgi:hypothetical protein